MGALVRREHLRPRVAGLHAGLELGEFGLGGDGIGHALGDVLLERPAVDVARRSLVVQRDARALGEADPSAVGVQLTRDDPQQRGLALAVAPDDREPVPGRKAEGDLMQDLAGAEALGDLNDFHKPVG